MTIEINFGLWLKWGWDKIKKANLSEKKWTTMIMKKIFIYYNDEKNTQTTINNRGVIKKWKTCSKKVEGIIKKTKKGYKEWLVTDPGEYLEKKKQEKSLPKK